MRSLLAPLVLGLVLSLAAVLGVQWSVVRVAIDAGMKEFMAGELAQDADELFSALVMPAGGATSLALAHFDPAFLAPASGRYYQIMVGEDIALRSPSLVYQSLPAALVDKGKRTVASVTGPKEQPLLMTASGYERDGRPVTIAVAADMSPVRAAFDRLLSRYTQVSLAMFALLVVLQIAIVRLALAPLRRVQSDVGRLERGEATQLGEAVPSEILPLVREVNRLLALLGERLQRSRQALGNLAHALKAPLTVLVNLADDEHVRRDPRLASQMTEQLAILGERIDSELRRARVAGGRAPTAALDLKSEIDSLAATLRKLYADRHLEIDCRVDPKVQFYGDREDLLEMCGNLLDNACKWARSRVVVSANGSERLSVTVEDDGPGCSADEAAGLAQRGVRLDESTKGHGLGLAIVKSIASSYGAVLRIGRSATLGGFEASVQFPGR